MDKFVIEGGASLRGDVSVSGAKNAALPLLFSTLLADGEHHFTNVPNLHDIFSTSELLASLGCETKRDGEDFSIRVSGEKRIHADYDLVRKMRASILCLGPLLARFGEAEVSLPGGCAIGMRPIDLHLDAMRALGAEIDLEKGYVHARVKKLRGAKICFPKVTVGGTENALMAAVLAEGETIIENAAREPEITDLADYLVKMGAVISGQGTSKIKIQGVERLKPTDYSVVPDRIEAGTLVIAGAITGGDVTVKDCRPEHIEALLEKMRQSGIHVEASKNEVHVKGSKSWKGVDIETAPHPGFPTDLQAQFMALMTVAEGTSVITESIFENRFMHVQELLRIGADIVIKENTAIVRGNPKGLTGAPVMATDLRASACLVLAGLVAQGETTVNRIYHLDRGYDGLEKKLSGLGAKVTRVSG